MRRPYRTGDQSLVREMNLSTVLRTLQADGAASRARLAEVTGLNKTTVSSLVEELLARGLVHEIGLEPSAGGRPATLVGLNPQAGCIVGVELGVGFVLIILSDLSGQVVWRRLRETDPAESPDGVVAQALDLVDEAVAAARDCGARLLGLGLTLPGLVDVERGVLIFSPNTQWRQVPLRAPFEARTGLPVHVDNDANAAAQGEHLFGVARQAHDFVFVSAGVGVGCGLFLNGELYRGAGGLAGEVGHTSLAVDGTRPCRCGNRGCWETLCNQYALVERVRARLEAGRPSLVSRLAAGRPLDLALVTQAADAGDPEALEAMAETGGAIGLGIANLINIFNPELVVLGGVMSRASAHLLPALNRAVEEHALPEARCQAGVVVSAFGPDASVMGAVALMVKAILSSPSLVQPLAAPAAR